MLRGKALREMALLSEGSSVKESPKNKQVSATCVRRSAKTPWWVTLALYTRAQTHDRLCGEHSAVHLYTGLASISASYCQHQLFEITHVFQCTAVLTESSYKIKTCCLLYNNPVVMVSGTGTGTLYYKPTTIVLPKKDGADAGNFNTRSIMNSDQ